MGKVGMVDAVCIGSYLEKLFFNGIVSPILQTVLAFQKYVVHE